jgi:hemolysin activation/secretion protein
MDGAIGTFDFFRSSLTLRTNVPLPGPLVGAVEVAGGASGGTVPVQSLWYLGGPFSLRGYDGAAAAGEEFWRARAEVANDFPAVRLALFADAGKAAPRGALTTRDALLGVGAGLSFFDGMMRLDVARATRAPTGWRVDFYFDGVI